MISEHIKQLLGEDLSTQVETALKGKGEKGGNVDLVCGNDGAFVPAEQLDAEKSRAAAALEKLKSDHTEELARLRRDAALRLALSGQVYDPADVMDRLDLEKIEVGEDGGLKTDLDELLRPIRESRPYLFKAYRQQPQPLRGARPAPVGAGDLYRSYTTQELGKLSMEEYAAYRAQHSNFPKH